MRLAPSNKKEERLISQTKRDTTNPIKKTEIDKKVIKTEAFTWL